MRSLLSPTGMTKRFFRPSRDSILTSSPKPSVKTLGYCQTCETCQGEFSVYEMASTSSQDWKGRPLHNISSWLRFVEKVSSGERSTGFSACAAGRHQNLGAPRDFQFYIPEAGLKQNDFADDRPGDRKPGRKQPIDEYWSN